MKMPVRLSDGTIRLKRTHDYYIQVLGQPYVAYNLDLKGTVFIVYFGEELPLFKENIIFESNRCQNEVLPKLEFFYRDFFSPKC